MATAMPAIDWAQVFERQELEAEIEQANNILDQPAEGEEGETLYSKETLDRAVKFLRLHIEEALRTYSLQAPSPKIGPGPNRSVDLYWRQPSWKLLVNIPADAGTPATFYGDDYESQRTKGSLDPKKISITVLAWLMTT